MIKIYCDGGSRGNPGKSAAAFVVEEGGRVIYSKSEYLGLATNNFAEYSAVLSALCWLVTTKLDKKNKWLFKKEIVIILDSELVVRQINGEYKIKNKKLKEIYLKIQNILNKLSAEIIFKNVTRGENEIADLLVNKKLNSVL